MKTNKFIIYTCFLVILCSFNLSFAQKIVNVDSWGEYFNEHNINGTFVLTKLNSDSLFVLNFERAQTRYLPASTFKIPNSLISLESNVIKNESEIIKWDGKKRFYDNWNKDQNLKSAIKYSCVWFYQELAKRVGKNRMQFYLDTLHYGNQQMGADVDKFWLEGDLKISAVEQIKFLTKFLNRDLPFSEVNLDIVESILLIDSTDNYRLFAKSGWGGNSNPSIGWYVGFVKNVDQTWVFTLNIDIYKDSDIKFRELISRKILQERGIIK